MNFTTCNRTVPRIVPVTACLLIGIAMFIISGCADQKQQAEGLVRAAIRHSEAGRHSEAVQLASRAIALKPGLAEAFYLRGSCLSEMDQSQKAVADFSAATRLKPDWDEAWCALGISQMASGATEPGVASLTKALQLNSKMQSAWQFRARGYRDLHRTDYELLDIEALLQLDPTHSEALLRHGTLLSETNPAQAIEDLSDVIRRDRNNATAWMQRGLCYHRTGDTDRALADLNIAGRLRADDFHAWLERGRILYTLERFDDAISDLSKAAELAPDNFFTHLELGRAYLGNSNLDAASVNLLAAERLSPHDSDLRLALAKTDIAHGRKPAALERLRSLLADENSLSSSLTSAARIHLAELLLESNETAEAMSCVDEILATEPAHSDALRIHAALLAKSNRREAAIEDSTRLISSGAALEPDAVAQSFLDRGRLQLDAEEWSAASQNLSKYLEVYPDDIAALTLRARAFMAQNDASKAITDLTLAILQKPDADLYTLRAAAFDQLQEPAAALADLRKAANQQSAYDRLNQHTDAVADYEKTLQLNPGIVGAWDNLAWLLATSDNQNVRDPERAVRLATQACELSEFKDWTCVKTLATCYAENQEFDAAVKWAKQARAIAPEANRPELDQLVAASEARLKAKRIAGKSGGSVR